MTPAGQHELAIDDLAEVFRVMGDANRLRILVMVLDQPRAVAEIAAAAGLSQSLVSHNLGRLRASRLVRAERRGKQVFYAAADQHVRTVLRDMLEHVCEAHRPGRPMGRG
jgi:DNA-binding transcriptional ArsR family regulator